MLSIKSFVGKTFACSALFAMLMFSGCSPDVRDKNEIYLGTIAGPESDLVKVAQTVALEKYGLNIKIVEFEDYNTPNTALVEGSIDANMFQHGPYLDFVAKSKQYEIEPIGKMFIYPMAVYSTRYKSLSRIPDKAIVGIPNDPSNEARALLLLAKAGLIKLDDKDPNQVSLKQVSANPKLLRFKSLDAAQLPRALEDLDLAVINTNYAIPAGLKPKEHALYLESKDSPYANLVVIRSKEKGEVKYQQLMEALHSQAVIEASQQLFEGQAIKAW